MSSLILQTSDTRTVSTSFLNPLNTRPEHEATHMPFVEAVLERRLHWHEIFQTVAWSDVNSVETTNTEDDPHCRLAVQFCMLNKLVLFVCFPITGLFLFVFAATFVTVKVPKSRWPTLPSFLFLIGWCGSSVRGSQTRNHRYQTCFMFTVWDQGGSDLIWNTK